MKFFHVIVRELNTERRAHHAVNAETDLGAGKKALESYHSSDYTVEKVSESNAEKFAKDTEDPPSN